MSVRRLAALASITASAALAPSTAHGQDFDPVDELGSQLLPLRDAGHGDVADARDAGVTVEDERALVDVYVSGQLDRVVERLEALGMEVEATAREPLPVAEGWLPVDRIADSARLSATDAVLPVLGGGVDVGAVTAASVGAHNIPVAIAALGTSGAGVDVGVISDSINQVGGGVNASQASGDLPPDPRVEVLSDHGGQSDEGRAMAEIIFDEAPGLSRVLFASGTALGAAGKAGAIDALRANGADVIADDIFYLSEPFFQDGAVSQAVDRAKAAGVAYFASAGNRARQSYEGGYVNSGGLHDFDPGGGVDTRSCFDTAVPNTPGTDFVLVSLQWAEPWGGAQTNLDLRITNPAGAVLAQSTTNNIATGIPNEIAVFSNAGAPVVPCVEIQRVAGAGMPFMKWIEQDNLSGNPTHELATNSNTINPDAASATGSMAVAAVSVNDPGLNTPEAFSSRGPNTRRFDLNGVPLSSPEVRFNPDLAAADQLNTTVPGFAPFGGTSAATPAAAGIATLLRSANPNATVNEIYAQMSSAGNAIACTSAIPAEDCGAGFILANLAAAGLDRTGAVVGAAVDPARPTGKKGWYTGSVTVDFSVADPESPIETDCPDVPVTSDGTQTFTCNALSGGGPGAASASLQRDTKPPKEPKIKGIERRGEPPPKRKIKCKSSDATSGLDSCKIKGYSQKPGRHKLKATATDVAGLTSKSKFKYRVP